MILMNKKSFFSSTYSHGKLGKFSRGGVVCGGVNAVNVSEILSE